MRNVGEQVFRDLQSDVDAVVCEALSGRVDPTTIAPPALGIDETEQVTIHVLGRIGPPSGLPVIPEALVQLISSLVLEELQRRDVLDGKDPSARITSDHRRWLAGYAAEVASGWQSERERGQPG